MLRRSVLAAFAASLALPAAAQDNTIRILAPTWVGFAPALVAQDLGCYEEEGVALDFRFEDDRANVMAAMERGDIDADMRTVGEHQGRPRASDTPGTIIGTIDISVGGDGVLVDGSIASVEDLKGKIVAMEPNIPARLLLQMELAKVGLSINDIELREIATADTIAVFSDPSIAAVGTYEPFLGQAVQILTDRNPRVLVSSREEPDIIVDVTEIIETSLAYTTYEEAMEFLGTDGGTGKLHPIFDQVMQLNIDYGAADNVLSASEEIDNSLLTGLFDGRER
jgi:NitT/TauT family transport system substrate-binding protein